MCCIPWGHKELDKSKWQLNCILGFFGSSAGEESTCIAGELGSIPVLGGSSRKGKDYSLQYCCLENSMDFPWGHKELDTPEWLSLHISYIIVNLELKKISKYKWLVILSVFTRVLEAFPFYSFYCVLCVSQKNCVLFLCKHMLRMGQNLNIVLLGCCCECNW